MRKKSGLDINYGGRTLNYIIGNIRTHFKLSQTKLAEKAGISIDQLGRIEKYKTQPTISVAWRLSLALNCPLDDLLNLTEYVDMYGPWIKVPHVITTTGLIEQANIYNTDPMLHRYMQIDRYEDRVKLYLAFHETISSYEQATTAWKEYQKAEYYHQEPFELEPEPEKLMLGEAFEAVRRLRDITTVKLAKQTELAQSVFSKFENNQIDISISNYDKIVRVLGVSANELIAIARPPKHRWGLLLPHKPYPYTNKQMLKSHTVNCLQFSSLKKVEQRAEVILAFRDWLTAETNNEEKRNRSEIVGTEVVPTPTAFERLPVLALVTNQ